MRYLIPGFGVSYEIENGMAMEWDGILIYS
jgi:hypothetical protein